VKNARACDECAQLRGTWALVRVGTHGLVVSEKPMPFMTGVKAKRPVSTMCSGLVGELVLNQLSPNTGELYLVKGMEAKWTRGRRLCGEREGGKK